MRDDAKPESEGRSLFGHLLREFRIAAGLSQEALAERAGVSISGISALERGTRRAPHRDTIALLASALALADDNRNRLQAAAVRPSIPRRSERHPDAAEPNRQHNLPLPLTSFFGREAELRDVAAAIVDHRLVTLTGFGGVGKTRLALETAHAIVERFQHGVCYVELAPVHDPSLVAQRIAATLGGITRSETDGPNSGWIAPLVEKHLLIVLDNCEHVLEDAAAIAQEILERCPLVRIVATSREALRVGGEYVIPIDPLDVPAARAEYVPKLADLRASPAIQLFLDRARHVAPRLKLGEDLALWRTLGNVCARLDGIPLAIELAAARVNAMTLDMLSRELAGRFHLLTTGARTALPRHQTLRALIDWSYELLSEPERRVFRRLGIFSGGWTPDAARDVCDNDAESSGSTLLILASLVDKSLVIADHTCPTMRYGMLETTRVYALDRLTAEGERDEAARRHAQYFCDLLTAQNASYKMIPLTEWLVRLEPEVDNLRAALEWSLVDKHDVLLGATIVAAQRALFESLSLEHEGGRWSERALQAMGSDLVPELGAPLQFSLARFYILQSIFDRAAEAAQRSSELYRMLQVSHAGDRGTRLFLGAALASASYALARLCRFREAERCADEAIAIARELSDNMLLSYGLFGKSLGSGDIVERRALLDEALMHSRFLPSGYVSEAVVLVGFSLAEFDAGNIALARDYAARAVSCCRSTGLHRVVASWALGIESTCACLSDDLDGAIACARERLSLFGGGASFFFHDVADHVYVIASVLAERGCTCDAARLIGSVDAAVAKERHPAPNFARVLHERTMRLLQQSAPAAEIEAWRAEGRGWSYEQSIAAALAFERSSRGVGSRLYG